MKSAKSKAKGVTMQEPSESGTRVRVPPPQIDPKDKGKAKMVEPEKPKKKKDQIQYDADVNMAGYKHTQLKNKRFKEIQMLFEKEMKRVNIFVDMDAELVKGSETQESEVNRAVSDSELAEELRVKEADELSQEELQQMMIIVLEQGMNEASKEYSFLKLGGYMILMVHHEAIEKGNDIYMLGREESPIVKEPLHNAVAKPWSIKIMRCPRELLQERNSCMLKNQENKVLEYILLALLSALLKLMLLAMIVYYSWFKIQLLVEVTTTAQDWKKKRRGGVWRNEAISHLLCILDGFFNVTVDIWDGRMVQNPCVSVKGVLGTNLESMIEVTDLSFLVVDHPMMLSMDEVLSVSEEEWKIQ
ncbi:hypothetical protein Tco_0922422 [Tanacetum coccineum]|uniref:Uncharacterized protein n=1 Tax=Tanacetum coccineum TaxID=301880 RepID=A0ABQ5CZ08_9ASTR